MREFQTTVSTGRSPRSLIARRRSSLESQNPSQLTGSLRVIARIARVNGSGAKLPYEDRSTAVIVGFGLEFPVRLIGGGEGRRCPVSEVRNSAQHPLILTSETKGHQQLYDSSAASRFEVPIRVCCSGVGTSNRRH